MPLIFGKSRKFNALLEEHWPRLYNVCYAWSHNPHVAGDLVQDTIESALRHYRTFNEPQHLNKWLYTVLMNKWRDYCRKQARHTSIDTDPQEIVLSTEFGPDDSQQLNDTILRIYSAMNKLSIEHREVLSLVALEGFSYDEVANILETPIGTVMSRLYRGRKLLRQHLSNLEKTDNQDSINQSTVRRIK